MLADALGVRPDELFLTTSGTAAIQAGLTAVAAARQPGRGNGRAQCGRALRRTAHGCVPCGVEVGVDRLGRVDLDAFAAAVRRPGVAVAALQSANHEVGTRQPIEAAAAAACGDVPLFVDAAASVGHDVVPAGWSALTASAHKWGGPAGVGLLAVRKGDADRAGLADGRAGGRPLPRLPERPATRSPPPPRCRPAWPRRRSWTSSTGPGSTSSRHRVAADIPDVEVVGDPDDRLPHVLTFSCLYVDGEALVTALDAEGFAVSSGSACTSSTLRPSHVLAAMGVLTHGNVRVSLGRDHDVRRDRPVLRRCCPGLVQRIRAEVGM